MATPLYHMYGDDELNKDTLIKDESFIDDAANFLIEREGKKAVELDTNEKVYDAYMEHFRFQNVNEVTAIRDMTYAQNANDEQRARFGRLMDTYDRMDSDLGLNAALDYAEGVFTAPSTYAGIFSFGAAKAGAVAANQGIKVGIRQAIKNQALKSAAVGAMIDAPVAAATVAAQEQTRVETGIKEDIDMTQVGGAAVLSTLTAGVMGGVTGSLKYKSSAAAQEIVNTATKVETEAVEEANKLSVKVFKDKGTKKIALNLEKKLSLEETIPEELKRGEKIKEMLTPEQAKLRGELNDKIMQNIAAASARIYKLIPPREGIVAGSAEDLQERFVSRITRGIRSGVFPKAQLKTILKDHNVSIEQIGVHFYADLGAVVAEEASRAGRTLGAFGKGKKEAEKYLMAELNLLDDELLSMTNFSNKARIKALRKLEEDTGINLQGRIGDAIRHVNKARVGLMTVQTATTVRNTTNGYMRNYIYALDNLGSGLFNMAKGNVAKLGNLSTEEAVQAADNAVKLGKAQMRVAADSARMKDLVFGISSAESLALERIFRDGVFGNSEKAQKLFLDMGDVADQTGAEGGLMGVARKLNTLNTMSDNMFKRAIFSRELDKQIRQLNPERSLRSVLEEGNFSSIPQENIADAMEKALDFTYQTGKFKGKEGGFNTFADAFIKFGQTTGGSILFPFPRYMVNQFRFMYEHMPVFGLYDFAGVLNKSEMSDRIGKQMTGLTMLGTFFALRSQFGDETTGPYEYKDPTSNDLFDAKATLGPFSAYAMLSDYFYRSNFGKKLHDNEKVATTMPYSVREFYSAITGGQGRAGTQLAMIDGIAEVAINGMQSGYSEERLWENIAAAAGGYLSTYTVGAGVLKDMVATIDPEFRYVPDNTDVELLPYMLKQATRSFPQTVDPEANGFLGMTGIGPQRTAISQSPTRSGGLKYVNPFIKQLTGLTPKEGKTYMEKELGRLGFDYFEISPARIKLDKPLSNEAKGLMGKYMERRVASYVSSRDYKGLPNDKIKRIYLKQMINKFRSEAKSLALDPDRINTGMTSKERNRRFKTLYYNKVPAAQRTLIEENYKIKNNGRTIDEDGAYEFALSRAEGRKELKKEFGGN
tara:strand:- start:12493 stop:15804 length:3312 start_codon:yes stop_codon:yes gene_type:complete